MLFLFAGMFEYENRNGGVAVASLPLQVEFAAQELISGPPGGIIGAGFVQPGDPFQIRSASSRGKAWLTNAGFRIIINETDEKV